MKKLKILFLTVSTMIIIFSQNIMADNVFQATAANVFDKIPGLESGVKLLGATVTLIAIVLVTIDYIMEKKKKDSNRHKNMYRTTKILILIGLLTFLLTVVI